MIEQWKDIPGYEGLYQVSNMGNVKSLNYNHTGKEGLLNKTITTYVKVALYKANIKKYYNIHQLVAMAFLGHEINGFETVVNHIDNNPSNNRLDNLELVTTRYNSSCHKTDVGVSWHKRKNKWQSNIIINSNKNYLGIFKDKQDAIDIYQLALANIHLYDGDAKAFRVSLKQLVHDQLSNGQH
jgi:hypothetical protein